MRFRALCALAVFLALTQALSAAPVTLTVFGAGTLAAPFKKIDEAFMRLHPQIVVQAQFGGSVKMVKQVTELHQLADVVAVADYNVIPKYLFGANGTPVYSDWYAGFATNAITFVYTDRSSSPLSSPRRTGTRSSPVRGFRSAVPTLSTDPSGYQTVQMLALAEKYYGQPGLEAAILHNAPTTNMRDTETELIAALQSGQIDYLAIYLSDARQHGFQYLELSPEINLSDARFSPSYAQASVQTANGSLSGKPIVYAVTIPNNAVHPDAARMFLQFLLGVEGQKVMKASGFGPVAPAYANDLGKVPAELKPLVTPWP